MFMNKNKIFQLKCKNTKFAEKLKNIKNKI